MCDELQCFTAFYPILHDFYAITKWTPNTINMSVFKYPCASMLAFNRITFFQRRWRACRACFPNALYPVSQSIISFKIYYISQLSRYFWKPTLVNRTDKVLLTSAYKMDFCLSILAWYATIWLRNDYHRGL